MDRIFNQLLCLVHRVSISKEFRIQKECWLDILSFRYSTILFYFIFVPPRVVATNNSSEFQIREKSRMYLERTRVILLRSSFHLAVAEEIFLRYDITRVKLLGRVALLSPIFRRFVSILLRKVNI